jgi:hypothetical protein
MNAYTKERNNLEDFGIDKKIILKWILQNKKEECGTD